MNGRSLEGSRGKGGSSDTYALTGAGGKLGGLTLSILMDLVPARQIIATSRRPEGLAEFASQGVRVRTTDFNDPEGLEKAFSGATRLLIISSDAMEGERRLAQQKAAIEAAARAGIGYVAFTSCPGASLNSEHPFIKAAGETEAMLARSGMAWTALRNNIYMEGVAYFMNALREGEDFLVPEGPGKPCWIAREDCARAAAFALAGKAAEYGALELTGPEALGFADLASRWVSLCGGKSKAHVLPDAEIRKRLRAKGLHEAFAEGLVGQAALLSRQAGPAPSKAVETITGEAPRSVDGLLLSLISRG